MTLLANGKLDWAEIRLLGPETEPKITPRVLIFHTMVGNLQGTDSYFRHLGYEGDESTWGVGGPWEGAAWDGKLYQWQLAGYQADAQFAGNNYADSVETADGGVPTHPWSSKQLDTLIKLTVDWCLGTKNPCQLIAHESDHGLGYHSQFEDWNLSHHTCPGEVRIGQLRTIVIPKARALINGDKPSPVAHPIITHPDTSPHLSVDGIFGHQTIAATQIACGLRGSDVDGIWGPASRKALQHKLGVRQDGIIGPVTIKAWCVHLRTKGFWPYSLQTVWNRALTAQHQKTLNASKF